MRDLIFVSLEDWDEIWRRNQFVCVEGARRHSQAFAVTGLNVSTDSKDESEQQSNLSQAKIAKSNHQLRNSNDLLAKSRPSTAEPKTSLNIFNEQVAKLKCLIFESARSFDVSIDSFDILKWAFVHSGLTLLIL